MASDLKNRADRYQFAVGWSEEDQVYISRVAEFPSLAAHGDNPEEALREIRFVVSAVLDDMESNGEQIPEPLGTKKYSGKISLRMPEFLHRQLATEAAWQGVSLNQLMIAKLAQGGKALS